MSIHNRRVQKPTIGSHECREHNKEEHFLCSLGEILPRKHVSLKRLRGGKDFVSRMTALGFSEDVEVEVIQNYGHGPIIVLVRGVRVALGHGKALKVLVTEVERD